MLSFVDGKLQFIKAVRDAASASGTSSPHSTEEAPTLSIVEYEVPLPNGQVLTFLDTPGFDGYQAGSGSARETEEILQALEDQLAAKGTKTVSHVFAFFNPDDMTTTELKGRARRTFERLFPTSKVICITTRWDQIDNEEGLPLTVEEARRKEENLYTTSEGFLGYLLDDRKQGDLRFRSGLPVEAYSTPQDIILKLFSEPGSDTSLEEKLEAVTKERDEIASKYNLLLQEKGDAAPTPTTNNPAPGPKHSCDDSTTGPKEDLRTRRTRRQRLLDTISKFSSQVLELVAELDREALDSADELKAIHANFEAASTAKKEAEARFTEALENVKAVVGEYRKLQGEHDFLKEQEKTLTTELDGLQSMGGQSPVRAVPGQQQRLAGRLKRTQGELRDTEDWMAMTEGDYQKGCQQVEGAAAEIEKLKRIEQGRERELKEWLTPESEWFAKERDNFATLHQSVSAELDIMREGLKDSWEAGLGGNAVFLAGLGGYAVDPAMVETPGTWAPVIESLYESQVVLALSKEMVKFHSAVLERLKTQEENAFREWKKGVEDTFGRRTPYSGFRKSSLPQLIPSSITPGNSPLDPASLQSEPDIPQELPPFPPPLEGHDGAVTSVKFSWDGKRLISGALDNTVRVWDASSGKEQNVLRGHSGSVTSVAISGDGSCIVSGSEDKTVRLWHGKTGAVQRVLVGHSGAVKAVAVLWDGSRICSGSDDRTARVWDGSTGDVLYILEGHSERVISVAFSRDGTRIATGGWDNTVRLWSPASGNVHKGHVLEGHTSGIPSLEFSMDGKQIVSGSYDNTARLWDVLTGKTQRVLEGHKGLVTSVAMSQDGTRIVSGSYDNTLRVWDALTGTVQRVLAGHSNVVWSVAFSPDGRRVASGAFDNTIRVWDPRTSESLSPGI